jgi:hypothetical protein
MTAPRPSPGLRDLRPALALLLLLVLPGSAQAQQFGRQPSVDATQIALNWLKGRWEMPITCTRADDTQIELREGFAVRATREDPKVVKLTLFGIDEKELKRCYNLAVPEVPDRRGVVYLTFRSSGRTDLGPSDFRQRMRDGELRYHVERGRVHVTPIGGDAEPEVRTFSGSGWELVVRLLERSDDGFRMLKRHAGPATPGAPLPRAIEVRLEGPDDYSVGGFYIENVSSKRNSRAGAPRGSRR